MIRPMRLSDAEEMYKIAARSLSETYVPDMFFGFLEQWRSGQFVSCDFLGNVIGFICCTRLYDGGCRIMLFAMDPLWQGKGKGTELLEALRRQAIMERIRYITLEVRAENVRARSFYRKHGFMDLDTMYGYYNDGGDAVRMDLFIG